MLASFALVDRRQRLGHAVDERLGADEAGARIGLRLPDQMLGAAEADFEPNVVDRRWKQRGEISGAGDVRSSARRGSSVSNSSAWRARKRMPLAPAEEGAVPM